MTDDPQQEEHTPNYWISLFTWHTWQEFLEAGGDVDGFSERRWRTVRKMQPGDLLLCYLTGISRFIGVLEVTGEPYKSFTSIWSEAVFPSRVPVRTLMSLRPEYGVPVTALSEDLSYFQNMKAPFAWWGHFNASPTAEAPEDAGVILDALQDAVRDPVYREFDPRKLERKVRLEDGMPSLGEDPNFVDDDPAPLTVPEVSDSLQKPKKVTHDEIQYTLLHLGSAMGLDVWVARNDRGRSFDGNRFLDVPRLRKTLPRQFDNVTNRTIELIDVLWLQGSSIVAAFEVEHTSAVYSGLLRMSDLVAMQPNLNINLYIVAPDERRDKVFSEINRPTFVKLGLQDVCSYIPYSALRGKVEAAADFLQYLKPTFLDELAERFSSEANV